MHDGAVPRERAHLRGPRGDGRRVRAGGLVRGALPEQPRRVEGREVGDDGLARAHLPAVAQAHASRAAPLAQDGLHVGVELQRAAVALEPAHEGIGDLAGAPQGHGEGSLVVEEALQDVEHVRRHGTLGREAAEDAHGVDEVAEKRHGHVLVHHLVQRVEEHVQVPEDVRVRRHVREGARGRREEARVLSEVEERDRLGGPGEGLEARAERVPLGDGLGAVLAALLEERALKVRLGADGEAPVALRGPIANPLVGLCWEVLAQDVDDHAQGVDGRLVETFEDGGAHLEGVGLPLVHAREGVR
mmetsp:Transcript_12885/g.43655  ORF Transcript_12885/g.43655 Transcript_12885/m.43655 type:complete len:302 (-) Transcript_12885:316-1221(-)